MQILAPALIKHTWTNESKITRTLQAGEFDQD